jgi:hypothetical protein
MSFSYTPRENRQRAGLTWKAVRRAASGAGMSDLERRRDRINERAEERCNREADEMWRRVEKAKNAHASAVADERTAKSNDKPAKRRAVRDAQRELDRVQRAAKKYGI